MKKRLIGILALSSLIAGCATAQPPSAVNNLQIKVAHLEKKLELRDEEINTLKYEMQQLSAQMESFETFQLTESPTVYTTRDLGESPTSSYKASAGSSSDEEKIVRVDVDDKIVQEALKKSGYYNGAIDGKVGSMTKKAIKEFQADHDLKADGIVGAKTWEQMKFYLD